jgi:hypothetical protein
MAQPLVKSPAPTLPLALSSSLALREAPAPIAAIDVFPVETSVTSVMAQRNDDRPGDLVARVLAIAASLGLLVVLPAPTPTAPPIIVVPQAPPASCQVFCFGGR